FGTLITLQFMFHFITGMLRREKMKSGIYCILTTQFILSVVFLTGIALSAKANASTYYVAANGNDSNQGTITNPFLTIQRAADVMVAGDTALIRKGTYQEEVNVSKSGIDGAYITFQNYGSEQVIIDAQGKRNSCITLTNGASYLQFIGLRLSGATAAWPKAGFYAVDNSSHLILDRLEADHNLYGIMLFGSTSPVSFVTIKNCKAHDNTNHGVFLYQKVYDTVIGPGNHFYSNLGPGDSFGLEIATDFPGSQAGGAKRILVLDNEMDGNEELGMRTWNANGVLIKNNYFHNNGATGIQIEVGSQNVVIEDNRSDYNAQLYEYEAGCWVAASQNVVVRNNSFNHNKMGLIITKSSRVIAHGNIITDNNRGATNLVNAMGLNIDDNVHDIYIAQNTLYNNSASSAGRAAVSLCPYNSVASGICLKDNIFAMAASSGDLWIGCADNAYSSDYNLFYNTRALSSYYKNASVSWAAYVKGSGKESHSLTTNPQFHSTLDFSLSASSPAADSGDFLAVATSSGSGKTIPVTDAGFFTDGFGVAAGDTIQIGNTTAAITSIDYGKNTLTLDRALTWSKNEGISFPYSGIRPNIGAYQGSSGTTNLIAPTGLRFSPNL
ncbi:MAG: right-handed parallel beta-helix repeat-containing protein, partial [Syntrophobacteraceae bacterium]